MAGRSGSGSRRSSGGTSPAADWRRGVPSVTVFRDIDSKGQTEVVMRRFLDQAAFKARQEDGVLMLGHLRQDTLAALAVWTLADRASTVALAPASTLLRAQTEG